LPSGFAMVEFTTDGSVTYSGFTASWTSSMDVVPVSDVCRCLCAWCVRVRVAVQLAQSTGWCADVDRGGVPCAPGGDWRQLGACVA
jgi:hypothetical protein